MSVQSSNSRFSPPSGNHCGPNQSRPRPTLIACRICNKIFVNHLALIDHYDRNHTDPLRINHPWNRLETNNRYFAPSLAIQQRRHHPYMPNGYRPMRPGAPERLPVAPTMGSRFLHPRNPNPYSSFNVTSQNLATVNGNYVANNRQLVTHRYMHVSPMSQRLNSMIASQRSQQAREMKGFDEFVESETVWYLGYLEQAISKMSSEKIHDPINLDLTLKL